MIIIKFIKNDEENEYFLILIGKIDINSNKFCFETILNYINKDIINYHFDRLKGESFNSFINIISKDKKEILGDDNLPGGKKVFGSMIFLNSNINDDIKNSINNQEVINKTSQEKNKKESNIIPINQVKLKHVKFLLSLHFFQEIINYKINDSIKEYSFKEKYYLIKNEIINTFKEIYQYNELEKIYFNEEIQKLINKYKKQQLFIQECQMNELLGKITEKIGNSYYDLIKDISSKEKIGQLYYKIEKTFYRDDKELFYYTNCQLINEQMAELLIENGQILEDLKVNCAFGENAAFLSFGKIINIGKLDNNCIFNPEIIIKLKDEKSVDSIFNQIKLFNFNLYKENLKSSQIHFNVNQNFDHEVFIISKENDIINNFTEQNLTKQLFSRVEKNDSEYKKTDEKVVFINESLKKLILFYIDYTDLKKKCSDTLKNNNNNGNFCYYYLLNYSWFLKYIEIYNLTKIYTYLMTNDVIGSINNYETLHINDRISAIMVKINQIEQNVVDNSRFDSINNSVLKNNDLFNLKINYFKTNSDISFKYFSDFVLIKKEAYELFTKDLQLNYNVMNYCFFGNNQIYMYLNEDKKYTIQAGHLSKNNYYFSTDMFLDFNTKPMFDEGINLLINEGIENFWKKNLILFRNDFYSPIFGKSHNIIIGNLFMFNKNNTNIEYQNLFINSILKTLILFYLEEENLKKTIMTKEINKFRKYYLINTDWLKKYKNIYGYQTLVNDFKNCKPISEKISNLKGDEKLSFTEKELCFLIKNLDPNININFNKMNNDFINNFSIEPNNELFKFQANNSFTYFNNFEIISEEIYNRIFGISKSNGIDLNKQKNNYVNIIFYEKIFMIELTKYVSGLKDYVIETGYFDNNNIFIPSYVSIYKSQKIFIEHMNYLNKLFGIKNFYNKLVFNEGCSLPLFGENSNNEIGRIYNLKIKYKENKNNQIPNANMNNNCQFNNFNNNSNNNLNKIQNLNNNNNNLKIVTPSIQNNNILNNQNILQFNNIKNNNFKPVNNNCQQFNNNQINNIQQFNNNPNNNFQQMINQNINFQKQFNNNQNINFQNQFNNNHNINFQNQFNNNQNINFQQRFNNNQINNFVNRPFTADPIIKRDFPKPPLMGLQNVGATCYMNATLQCFSQIDKLVDYFKYKPYIEEVINKYRALHKPCLTESFKELIENLWPSNLNYIKEEYVLKNSNNSYFAPYKFKEKISDMNELFQGAQANDSKDLVNFIIMTLHEEMNRVEKSNQNKNNFMNIEINQTNKNDVLQNFMKFFQGENKSKISDLFYAQNNTMTTCQKCKETKYNFQTYFFLIFPLEEVRKFNINIKKNLFIQNYNYMNNINPILFQKMLNNFLFNIQNQNSVNIYNCFEYNRKVDFFTGDNSMYCNRCKAQFPASYMTQLYTGPEILIIVLNRGVGIQYKVKLEFTESLDLTYYIEEKNTGCLYNLIGVVTHMGESGANGHFIAYCKSPIDKQWYRYNDDLVSLVYNFKQEIIDYAMPYILFFQKTR